MAYVDPNNELTADEIAKKHDVMALAELLLNIHQEDKHKVSSESEEDGQ